MIYKYTKCEAVIAKIMADLDSSEVRQRIEDIREWIFEATEKIGAPMQYIVRESGIDGVPIFKIQDYQIPMPADLIVLDGVAYSKNENGPWQPMSTATGLFKSKQIPKAQEEYVLPADPNNLAAERQEIKPEHEEMKYKYPTTQSQFATVNGMKYLRNRLNEKPEYFIKPGWIATNMRDGYIKLQYKAIATDERGYPLIPDMTSYQEAIYWYVVMKINFSKYLKGKLGGKGVNNNGAVYSYLQQQWNFYRNQAYAEAMMPTADDMQNIKRDWNKLIPDWDGDETFFSNIGKQQSLYNDYYYGY